MPLLIYTLICAFATNTDPSVSVLNSTSENAPIIESDPLRSLTATCVAKRDSLYVPESGTEWPRDSNLAPLRPLRPLMTTESSLPSDVQMGVLPMLQHWTVAPSRGTWLLAETAGAMAADTVDSKVFPSGTQSGSAAAGPAMARTPPRKRQTARIGRRKKYFFLKKKRGKNSTIFSNKSINNENDSH
jgi:hypothetical protein